MPHTRLRTDARALPPRRAGIRGPVERLVCSLLILGLTACGDIGSRPAQEVEDGPWRIGYVAPPSAIAALRGAELGSVEVRHAAELVGESFTVLTSTASSADDVAATARAMIAEGVFAIVGGFDGASCRALDDLASEEEVLFVNVGCREDELRASAGPNTFHVEASESMYRRARSEGNGEVPALWQGNLTRFGAGQLNERFERRFGRPPGSDEWASWMAIKLLWEAALRAQGTDARSLRTFLTSGEASFDGHKGEALSFHPEDRQLLQPLVFPSAHAEADEGTEMPGAELGGEDRPVLDLPLDQPLVLVSNEGSHDVAIVDAANHELLATIPVGSRPRGIHVAPDGETVMVALSDDAPLQESDGDAIAVIDLRTGQIVRRFQAGTDPEQFAIGPDGSYLVAANEDAGLASVTDPHTGEVVAQLPVGIEPEGVAVSPDGRWVYVTAETSNTVSVIDTRAHEVVASFLVEVRPRAAVFAPDGRTAYVTNEISGSVSVVDVASHAVTGVIELPEPAKPVGVVVSPDSRRVYVANGHAHSVSVIDAASNRVVSTFQVGRRPWGLQLSPDGAVLYTANGGSDDISVVETETGRVIATVPVGERPWGVAVRGGKEETGR